MSQTYPEAVYTWNHYDGESPDMDAFGLPLNYEGVNLPTAIPDGSDPGDNVPYSPVLMEMGATSSGSVGKPTTAATTANVPTNNPAKPALWTAVGNAIFGGNASLNRTNSSAAVASGTNTTIKS
jgi:hypothetical protein